MANHKSVLINGQVFHVLDEGTNGRLLVRRPEGIKQYVAQRLPDSAIYGENRARLDPTSEWAPITNES